MAVFWAAVWALLLVAVTFDFKFRPSLWALLAIISFKVYSQWKHPLLRVGPTWVELEGQDPVPLSRIKGWHQSGDWAGLLVGQQLLTLNLAHLQEEPRRQLLAMLMGLPNDWTTREKVRRRLERRLFWGRVGNLVTIAAVISIACMRLF